MRDTANAGHDDAGAFITLAEASRLTGRAHGWLWERVAAGLLDGRQSAPGRPWRVSRRSLAKLSPASLYVSRKHQRPWLRLVVDNGGADRRASE